MAGAEKMKRLTIAFLASAIIPLANAAGACPFLRHDVPARRISALASIIRTLPTDRGFAELLNEPDIDAERWQTEIEELSAFVRQLLPRTTLIVGPVNWQRADSLPGFRPLSDLNVVYAIHFYDP